MVEAAGLEPASGTPFSGAPHASPLERAVGWPSGPPTHRWLRKFKAGAATARLPESGRGLAET